MDELLDFTGKTVLVTGGTRGIGLETGLSFARRGAKVFLTYRWGDHEDDVILQRFAEAGAPAPHLIRANASDREETRGLLEQIAAVAGRLDVFISNVSSAAVINAFEDYSLKGLKQSISYSSFPLVAYLQETKAVLGAYPKHVVALSSTGPDHFAAGYDFVAASKTVMEVFVKYLNFRLRPDGVVINAVRAGAIRTESFEQTFGKALAEFAERLVPDSYWTLPQEVAEAIVALCSGYCDAISGQVVHIDKGTTFFDNLMELYTRTQGAPA